MGLMGNIDSSISMMCALIGPQMPTMKAFSMHLRDVISAPGIAKYESGPGNKAHRAHAPHSRKRKPTSSLYLFCPCQH